MITALLLSLLSQTGVCKAGQPCQASSFRALRPALADAGPSLDRCNPLSDGGFNQGTRGLLEYDGSDAGYVQCNGKVWQTLVPGTSACAAAGVSGLLCDSAGVLAVDAGVTIIGSLNVQGAQASTFTSTTGTPLSVASSGAGARAMYISGVGAGQIGLEIGSTGATASDLIRLTQGGLGTVFTVDVSGNARTKNLAVPIVHDTTKAAQAIESNSSAFVAGSKAITFQTAFGAAPVCVCSDTSGSVLACSTGTSTASAVTFFGTATDAFNWICTGGKIMDSVDV